MSDPLLTDPVALGAAVRRQRLAQGLTQDEVAAVAGVGRRFVIELEGGKSTARLGETLRVLAALGGGVALRER